jgi:hypothetical protein
MNGKRNAAKEEEEVVWLKILLIFDCFYVCAFLME